MLNQRVPWTLEDLRAMLPVVEARLAEAEASQPEEVRPLPPLTARECLDLFARLIALAATRPLTSNECFLHGQVLAQFQQAVTALVLGHKEGRYYVMSEARIREMLGR